MHMDNIEIGRHAAGSEAPRPGKKPSVPPGAPKPKPVKEPPRRPGAPDPTPIDDPRPPKPRKLDVPNMDT